MVSPMWLWKIRLSLWYNPPADGVTVTCPGHRTQISISEFQYESFNMRERDERETEQDVERTRGGEGERERVRERDVSSCPRSGSARAPDPFLCRKNQPLSVDHASESTSTHEPNGTGICARRSQANLCLRAHAQRHNLHLACVATKPNLRWKATGRLPRRFQAK